MKKDIQSFINLFGGKNLFVSSDGKTSMSRCTLSDIEKRNKNGNDIYFVINPSKGLKNIDVTHLVCNYIDLDAGRDKDKNYFEYPKVEAFKKKAMAAIKKFTIKPTMIVETRNGYHVYWNYKTPVPANYLNRSHWREVQDKILSYFINFGGDKEVQKVNQLLRVPYTKWHKTWSGVKQSFDVKVVKKTDQIKCFDFADLVKSFTSLTYNASKVGKKKVFKDILAENADWDAVADGPCSYSKKDDVNGNKKAKGPQTEAEMVSFLNDLSQVLYAKGMKYFSAQCKDMSEKILYK